MQTRVAVDEFGRIGRLVIIGNPLSALVDLQSTMTFGDRTVKVLAWYDNEWGYAARDRRVRGLRRRTQPGGHPSLRRRSC